LRAPTVFVLTVFLFRYRVIPKFIAGNHQGYLFSASSCIFAENDYPSTTEIDGIEVEGNLFPAGKTADQPFCFTNQ